MIVPHAFDLKLDHSEDAKREQGGGNDGENGSHLKYKCAVLKIQ